MGFRICQDSYESLGKMPRFGEGISTSLDPRNNISKTLSSFEQHKNPDPKSWYLDVSGTGFGDRINDRINGIFRTYLVGAQPPPCCSFARHLVGKMDIHCSFAHH